MDFIMNELLCFLAGMAIPLALFWLYKW